MATLRTGLTGNGGGGEDLGVHSNRPLINVSEIQQQLSSLSRQMGHPAPHLLDNEQQRAGESAATAATMRAPTEAE